MASTKTSQPCHTSGRLFIIGGKAKHCVGQFVALAGGPQAHVLVIPHASSIAAEVASDFSEQLRQLGVQNIVCAKPEEPLVIDPAITAVYMCGGDQGDLIERLGAGGINLLLRFYQGGGLIAGTSAGAAAVGVDIITGGMADGQLRVGSLQLGKGLALADNLIVDTHFGQRGRFNRLLAALVEFPAALAIGLDEDTAVLIEVVRKKFRLSVYGCGHVTFCRRAKRGKVISSLSLNAAENRPGALYSVSGVNVSVLSAGQVYAA